MSDLTGTFPCPLCDAAVDVTITVSTVPVQVDGVLSFTVVATPVYAHVCGTHGNEAADDG